MKGIGNRPVALTLAAQDSNFLLFQILIEQVFGIHGDAKERKITWRITCPERHGVLRYPIGDGCVNLVCPAHSEGETPDIQVSGTVPATVEAVWPDGSHKEYTVK